MSLITAVALLWGTWALLRFWVRERLLPPASVPFVRLALRTIVDQLIVLSFAGAAALSVLQLLVWGMSLAGTANAGFLRGLLALIGTAADRVSAWSEAVGIVLLLLLTLASAILWYLHARTQSRRRIEVALEREIDRILRERETHPEVWNALPPNEAMEQMDGILSTLHDQWQAVQRDATLGQAERASELQAIEAQATPLIQLRQGIDVRRRVQKIDSPDEGPANWRERLTWALASRGLIGDARSAASYLGLLATVLALLTTVGFASGPMASTAFGSVNALELRARRSQAEQALGNAAPAKEPDDSDDWSDEDERGLQQLSNSIVRVSFESRSFPVTFSEPPTGSASASTVGPEGARPPPDEWARPPDAWEQSRRDQVRRGILESGDASSSLERSPTTAPDTVERTVQVATDPARHEATVTRVARETQNRLRTEIRRRPTLLRAFRAHVAEYQQIIHPADLRAGLVSALFGHAAGEVNLPPEIQRVVMPLVEDTGEAVLHEYLRVNELRALESLARGEPIADAFDRIRYGSEVPLRFSAAASRESATIFAIDGTRRAQRWLDEVQPRPGATVYAPSSDAVRVATTIAESTEQLPREAIEALATYDDYFPARPGGEDTTSLGTIERRILQARGVTPEVATVDTPTPISGGGSGASGAGGGGGGGSPAVSKRTRVSYARSRSFRMARGFARVGGVLIGRPPERRSEALSVNAITWTFSGREMTLRLGSASPGNLGPFAASTVDRALRYAADARVTTVTMTSAAPLLELKILLHPVLEDSPIGAAAIELDRLVDTYARSVPTVRAEEVRIQGQYALYSAAWTLRQVAVLEIVSARNSDTRGALARARARLDRLFPAIQAALQEPRGDLTNPDRSILAAKPAWFDKRLVGAIEAAAAAGTVEDFESRLLAAFKSNANAAFADDRSGQDTLEEWFEEPAQFEVWSGVREQPWAADASFSFATGPASDQLWPFQFMLQASFVSEPRFGDGQVDDSPFEFTRVAGDIQAAVARGIHSPEGLASRHLEVVAQMREFVILQRVFRLAIAGQLGRDFPLERLIDLAAAARAHRTSERTPRWNVRPGAIEAVVARLVDETQRAASGTNDAALSARLRACRGIASRGASQTDWEQRCAFGSESTQLRRRCKLHSADCALAERLTAIDTLTRARRLRQELGVQDDERLLESRR